MAIKRTETIKFSLLKQVPSVPETLIGEFAQAHWKKILKPLIDNGLVTSLDLPVIEMACQVWQLYCDCDADKSKEVETLENRTRYINCYLTIMKNYGVTPVARQKIIQEEKPKKTRNGDDELLKDFDL